MICSLVSCQDMEQQDAFFHLRELQEKYLAKKKNLYFAFVDLKKAFDRECLGSLYGRF